MGAVEVKAGLEKELLREYHVAVKIRKLGPGGSVGGIGHEIEPETGVVLDEVDAVGTHDASWLRGSHLGSAIMSTPTPGVA
jgi:hypothetical protein